MVGPPKTYSLCLDIENFIKNETFPGGYEDLFLDLSGAPLTPSAVLSYLTIEKAKGHKVIPCSQECGNPCKHASNGCAGFDYGGNGCGGRYVDLSHAGPSAE